MRKAKFENIEGWRSGWRLGWSGASSAVGCIPIRAVGHRLDFASGVEEAADKWGYCGVDNITDGILALCRKEIGDQVVKYDIFYVYGLLHDPAYRDAYAGDLKKMLPHIPTPESRGRFEQLTFVGSVLVDLHVDYESVDSYSLDVQLKSSASR